VFVLGGGWGWQRSVSFLWCVGCFWGGAVEERIRDTRLMLWLRGCLCFFGSRRCALGSLWRPVHLTGGQVSRLLTRSAWQADQLTSRPCNEHRSVGGFWWCWWNGLA
jgi:hypothetical protein